MVTVSCQRYATEDDRQRFTLDTDIKTDTGQQIRGAILEFKSTDPTDEPPNALAQIGLYPTKLSKLLWSIER